MSVIVFYRTLCVVMFINCIFTDICIDQFADYGQRNVQLVFNFTWIGNEPKKVTCDKDGVIGRCAVIFNNAQCEDTMTDTYKVSSNSDGTIVTVTILTFSENTTGKYSCSKEKYVNERQICITKTETLTSVNMFPQTTVVYSVYKETSTFECTCSISRPRSSIQWFENARNITHMANDTYISGVVRSVLTFVPQTQGTMNLSCVANYLYNDKSVSFNDSAILEVQFPVSQPSITFGSVSITNMSSIREGRSVVFRCSSIGYPPPSYHWIFPGGVADNESMALQFTRNAGSISCKASNTYFTSNGTTSNMTTVNATSMNINVIYPPSNISFKHTGIGISIADNNIRVIRGDNISIACDSVANPPATVFWMGQQGNSSTITVTGVQQNTAWTCIASNTLIEADGVTSNETVTRIVSATVLYKPVLQRLQNQTVLLNTSLTCNCNLTNTGNPPASNFTWIKKGNDTVVGTGQTLVLNSVQFSDEGEYQCRASNKMHPFGNEVVYGLSQSTVFINVEYGAYIRIFKANGSDSNITVEQDETINFVCDTDGDPEPVVRIVNATRENKMTNIESDTSKTTTQIQSARCEYDAGRYTCLASNKYNTWPLERALDVFVKCSPRASPFSPPVKDLYRAPNDSAVFTFTIKSYPKPIDSDYSWYKRVDGDWRDISSDANIVTHVSDDKMQTQLTIIRVQIENYTEYMVNVSNILGSTAEVFTLHEQSPPEVPKELHLRQVGKTELVVGWTPGFNGGRDQNFTIRYKAVDDGKWIDIYISSFDNGNYSTIGGLRSGTTYKIKMIAENQIGKSEWTEEITATTLGLVDAAVANGSALSAVGGAIGGVTGVAMVVILIILIWRCRSRDQNAIVSCATHGSYEDLVREPQIHASELDENYTGLTFGDPATLHGDTYDVFQKLEFREYTSLSSDVERTGNEHPSDNQPKNSGQTVLSDDRQYVNMTFSSF